MLSANSEMSKEIKYWVNDGLVDGDEAVVPVTDRSVMLGDGVFESVRLVERRLWNWSRHMDRLRRSLELTRIAFPTDPRHLQEGVACLAGAMGMATASVRITITRGSGSKGYLPALNTGPQLIIMLRNLPEEKNALKPLSACPGHAPVFSLDPLQKAKTTSRMGYVMAAMHARDNAVDECLMINERNQIAEWSSGNFLILDESGVTMLPSDCGALEGVTLPVVLEAARTLGLPVTCRSMRIDEIPGSGTPLLSNSLRILQPVGTVGPRNFPARADAVKLLRQRTMELLAEQSTALE